MNLSFKKLPKPAAKRLSTTFRFADDSHEAPPSSAREQIAHYDSSETPADVANSRKLPVIPPKPNERRPAKRMKMKNLVLPLQSSSFDRCRFQSQCRSLDDEANASAVSYGLTLRRRENGQELPSVEVKPEAPGQSGSLNDFRPKFGDDPTYEIPAEELAKAYLLGYGWQEGKGVRIEVKKPRRSFSKVGDK